MKTIAATLLLIASLLSQVPASSPLSAIAAGLEDLGGINTMADPPDDGGNIIIQPPPRN